jgi:hypothetical protein
VIASPPLVAGNYNNTHWWGHDDCLTEFKACLPTLLTLDKDPSPLIEHFKQLKSGRLGLRFEHFIAYWLIISPNYELLAQNIQIIEPFTNPYKKGSHTHGELDFIIRDTRTNKTIHLEVAVKFYLGCSPYEDSFRWFGTNTSDQLGKKVAHLKEHQTQLSDKFDSYLQERDHNIDEKQCFLKGRLFYPIGSDTAPKGVSKNHLRSRWIQSPNNRDALLCSIDKKDWLAQLNSDDLLNKNVQLDFLADEKAQCYVQINDNNEEIERVFHLPESFSFPV